MKTTRIKDCFAKAKAEGRGAFVAYLTMGFPTIAASEKAADEAIAGGADILELGVPFSDPFADGGVIRSAAYEAIRNGATLKDVIALAGRIRAKHPAIRGMACSLNIPSRSIMTAGPVTRPVNSCPSPRRNHFSCTAASSCPTARLMYGK